MIDVLLSLFEEVDKSEVVKKTLNYWLLYIMIKREGGGGAAQSVWPGGHVNLYKYKLMHFTATMLDVLF